jgi:S1-C subfamily serine protease
MKTIIKAAFLSSIITAAMVYVILEWRPLRPETSRPPEVSWASSPSPVSATMPAPAAPSALTEDEKNNIDIYQRYGPSVVNITTTTLTYDFFFRPVPESGTGSGAIIDTDGHIVTNHHVIAEAQRLEVTLWDKSKYKGRIVGDDPNHDLAVIQIDAPKETLKPIPIGTSKALLVGQKVLAIGNPYGLERTLTTGIISSLGRSIQTQNGRVVDNVIQTDAAINPGNSGGPLLNTAGEIIGINTAIISESGSSAGIGFAIPADTVREISGDLIKLGYVPHPYLGEYRPISISDYPFIARALRLNTDHGVLVTRILPGSPAARAGIRDANDEVIVGNFRVPTGGDVILGVDGQDIASDNELHDIIEKHKPGDRVTINVLRDGRKIDIPVVLAEAPRQ